MLISSEMLYKSGDCMKIENRKVVLNGKVDFQNLMKYVLNLRNLDVDVYFKLLEGETTVKELSNKLNCNRSTIQRALTNLVNKGLAIREPKTMKNGGYYFEYKAVSLSIIKERLNKKIKEWYATLSNFLEETMLKNKGQNK